MLIRSSSIGGQPPWLMTVQMSEVQKVSPYSKLGSASSCESPEASASASISEKRRRLAVPLTPPSTSSVVCERIVCLTVSGDALGYFSRQSAATPAANGADSEVPLLTLVAVGLEYQSDITFVPGAKRSTQLP